MRIVQHLCLLAFCYAVGQGHSSLDGGRNDGEPEYDPGLTEFELRQNDEEPDYLEVPDAVWQHEADQSATSPTFFDKRYLMLFPEDFKGIE